nr:hypothetical protein [Tanacetum cinerariifolium]
MSQLLKEHDEELWRHLELTTKVNPQFYAFRWITLLLTQEFNFADIFHIWDTLLSDPEGPQETLLRVCCAMLILVRRRLLAAVKLDSKPMEVIHFSASENGMSKIKTIKIGQQRAK